MLEGAELERYCFVEAECNKLEVSEIRLVAELNVARAPHTQVLSNKVPELLSPCSVVGLHEVATLLYRRAKWHTRPPSQKAPCLPSYQRTS